MDPISITAACVGLLSGLTTVSTKLCSLTADFKNANKEITALQNELDSCQRSLGLFYGSGDADRYPDEMKADLEVIIRECRNVVLEIDKTLDEVSGTSIGCRQKIQWSMTTRDEILRLHRNLEGHKSALTIAVAFASMSMNRDIKSDTSSIRSKVARIPEMQDQLAVMFQALRMPDGEDPQKTKLGLAMQRFLEKSDGQIVVDSSADSDKIQILAYPSRPTNLPGSRNLAKISHEVVEVGAVDRTHFTDGAPTRSRPPSTFNYPIFSQIDNQGADNDLRIPLGGGSSPLPQKDEFIPAKFALSREQRYYDRLESWKARAEVVESKRLRNEILENQNARAEFQEKQTARDRNWGNVVEPEYLKRHQYCLKGMNRDRSGIPRPAKVPETILLPTVAEARARQQRRSERNEREQADLVARAKCAAELDGEKEDRKLQCKETEQATQKLVWAAPVLPPKSPMVEDAARQKNEAKKIGWKSKTLLFLLAPVITTVDSSSPNTQNTNVNTT